MPDEPAGPGVRASHADRSAVADRLARAFADGRLTVAEFEERTEAAYRAVTREQLAVLTEDLPGRRW